MTILRPSFAGLDRARLLAATDADIAAWTEDAKRFDEEALVPVRARAEKHKQILALASEVWTGDDLKKAEKWLRTHAPRWPVNRWVDRVRDIQREAEEHRRKKAAEAGKAKEAERQARAIAWLAVRGKTPGKDYPVDRAIEAASEIAADEEIERAGAAVDGLVGFDGQNCDGPCGGWDGKSRRCECGNRRVTWTRSYGHSFEAPAVHAEAW